MEATIPANWLTVAFGKQIDDTKIYSFCLYDSIILYYVTIMDCSGPFRSCNINEVIKTI